MQLNELQAQMLRTANFDEPFDRALSLCALGLVGETGEISDCIKKIFYHHHDFDQAKRAKLIEEGGDVAWYACYFLHTLGLKLESVLKHPQYELMIQKPLLMSVPQTFTYLAVKLSSTAGFTAATILDVKDNQPLTTNPYYLAHFISLLVEPVAYLTMLAERLDSSLEEMCQVVIEKLNKRYPQGFSTADSIARRDVVA